MPEGDLTGVVRGKWGFDDWEGPASTSRAASPANGRWRPATSRPWWWAARIRCTSKAKARFALTRWRKQAAGGSPLKLAWKSSKPEQLEVTVPMKDAAPGPVTMEIHQFGLDEPDKLPLKAYAEAASLDRLTLSAGDDEAVLKGNRLDEVAKAELDGIKLTPAALSRVQDFDQLAMSAAATHRQPGTGETL